MPTAPQPRPLGIRTLALACALPFGLGACGPQTPEARVRDLLERAEREVEARDGAHLRGMMTENFLGRGTMTRESVMSVVNIYLLTHREIHVFSQVAELEMKGAYAARSVVYAALAAQPLESAANLAHLPADILRLELDIDTDESGDLRVTDADWRPASAAELIAASAPSPP